MADETQNSNPVTPVQNPVPLDPVPNLAPADPPPPAAAPNPVPPDLTPAANAPVGPGAPSVPGGTIDPIAAAPQPPTAGGVQMPQPTATAASYGGFWIRLLALIIDGVILGIVIGVPLNIIFGVGTVSSAHAGDLGAAYSISSTRTWIQNIITLAYFIGFTSFFGGTIGKLALGLRVVDANGQKIGIPKAILREFIGKFISAITIFIGYIMVGFDSKKQGLHDKIANTYVVKIR